MNFRINFSSIDSHVGRMFITLIYVPSLISFCFLNDIDLFCVCRNNSLFILDWQMIPRNDLSLISSVFKLSALIIFSIAFLENL